MVKKYIQNLHTMKNISPKNTSQQDPINIAMICDENFVFLTKICIKSIISSMHKETKISIWIIGVDLSDASVNMLETLGFDSVKIKIINKGNEYTNIAQESFRVSPAALFKFQLPNILMGIDKFLYIDGDCVVLHDLSHLFKMDITEKYAAVCHDYIGEFEKDNCLRLKLSAYFNSGVILFNAKKCRDDNISEQLIEWKKNDIWKRYMDQDALNAVFGENVIFLDSKYNFMHAYFEKRRNDFRYKFLEDIEDFTIIHYTPSKPNENILVEHADLFLQYCDSEEIISFARDNLLKEKKICKELKDAQKKQIDEKNENLNKQNKKIDSILKEIKSVKDIINVAKDNPWYLQPFRYKSKNSLKYRFLFLPLYTKISNKEDNTISILGGIYKDCKTVIDGNFYRSVKILFIPFFIKQKTQENKTIKILCGLYKKKNRWNGNYKEIKKYILGIRVCKKYKVSSDRSKNEITNSKKRIKICIYEGGGLGDALIQTLYIKEIKKLFTTPIQIDFVVRNKKMYENNPLISNVYNISDNITSDDYDVFIKVIRAYDIVKIDEEKIKKACPTFYKFCKVCKNIVDNVIYHGFDSFKYNQLALIYGKNRIEQSDLLGIIPVTRSTRKYFPININDISFLGALGLQRGKYITLNRACDGIYTSTSPKLWPLEYYNNLVRLLRQYYPEYKLVQIGEKETYGIISGIDVNLVGKTNLSELAIVLKYACLHIGNEGGLVHMRNFLHGKSVVLFGPTNIDVFGYEQNINLRGTNCVAHCDWVTKDWSEHCLRPDKNNICMKSLTPTMVFDAVSGYLKHVVPFNINQYKIEKVNYGMILKIVKNKKVAQVGSEETIITRNANETDGVMVFADDYDFVENLSQQSDDYLSSECSSIYNISAQDKEFDVAYLGSKVYDKEYLIIEEMCRIIKDDGCIIIENHKEIYLDDKHIYNPGIYVMRKR